MGIVPVVAILVILAAAGWRWGVDSRFVEDPCQRFWWPNG
jgi:hypothetical protein